MSVQIKNLDMASEVQVYNNFLSKTDFNELKKILLSVNFPYYFQISKVSDGDGFFQFTHIFYQNHNISSDYCDNLNPILDKLNVVSLMRIKANLQTKDSKIRTSAMHTDWPNPLDNQKTGIFYMNTNNGKTIFEDGEEINSVENRMIIFPASRRHAGTTHTDTMYRCLINFNWF